MTWIISTPTCSALRICEPRRTEIFRCFRSGQPNGVAAARTGKMSMLGRMFTMRMSQAMEKMDLMCCIPVDNSYDGSERVEFAETPALCIYYRGPYEGTATAIRALMEYVKKNSIETTGPFRSIYLEGPPNRGENSGDYITQVAVPIKG